MARAHGHVCNVAHNSFLAVIQAIVDKGTRSDSIGKTGTRSRKVYCSMLWASKLNILT